MARKTTGQKAYRVLRLLIGLRNPRIAQALIAHGFTEADLRDGWQRLTALSKLRKDTFAPDQNPQLILALDEFENTWFPIVRATLAGRFPEIAALFFSNLAQQTGPEVALSVGTFLSRLAQMEKGEGAYGTEGPKARAILVERGLTAAKVAEVQALVDSLGTFYEAPVTTVSTDEQRTAEDRLWAWYLEWSGIARVTISDGRLLRSLGFTKRRKANDEVIETDGTESPAPPAALPAAQQSASPLLPQALNPAA